jgi:two-component system sensor histidine kinase DesK
LAAAVRIADDRVRRERELRRFWPLIWLAYLPIYFAPWLTRTPGRIEIVASLFGVVAFLAILAHAQLGRWRAGLAHVLGAGAIGLALSPFETGWCVYSIFAMAFAGQLQPRRTAIAALLFLEISALVVGLGLGLHLAYFGPAVLVGGMTGLGSLLQSDVESKNRELSAAQEEIRALAVMAERERISRDLHDLLGHTLTLVVIKADLAVRLIDRDRDSAREEMEAVAHAAREAMAEVRTAVAGMRGASLAVEIEQARRALAAGEVVCEINADPILADEQQEAVLAMAVREAVTNVIRHAGATHCSIRVESGAKGESRLHIRDNGSGGTLREGAGLKGMRARLAAVGGALNIQSTAEGTHLFARLPGKGLS